MATEIPLGYLVQESEHSSTATCSIHTDSITVKQERTRDWISQLPREADVVGNGTKNGLEHKSKIQRTASPIASILEGPPASFRSWNNRWIPSPQHAMKNSLIVSVGFLELANACDFPANIWNQIPVPLFAAILMGIGGSIALLLTYCAVEDLRLSFRNIKLLRHERSRLRSQLQECRIENWADGHRKSIQACLAVNTREFGFEFIDRFLMDIIMGLGCVLVGIGTLLAIGGNNLNVFLASNLLSGYVGNSPAAVYGIINAAWSMYVWLKADTHQRMSGNDIAVELIWPQLSQRHDTIKLHAIVYGLTSLVAGAGSLMTATLWYGYVMLVPCVFASAWCNWLWRHRCGYSRPIYEVSPVLNRDLLIKELQNIAMMKRMFNQRTSDAFVERSRLKQLLEILQRYDLMIEFCLELSKDAELKDALFGAAQSNKNKIINISDIMRLDERNIEKVIRYLDSFMYGKKGQKPFTEALIYRERYLLELLGSWFFYQDQTE